MCLDFCLPNLFLVERINHAQRLDYLKISLNNYNDFIIPHIGSLL